MAGVILARRLAAPRVFPGETSDFILEIPPMRRPQLGNVVQDRGAGWTGT